MRTLASFVILNLMSSAPQTQTKPNDSSAPVASVEPLKDVIPKIPRGIIPKTKWVFKVSRISMVELSRALFSKDRPTSRMAKLFFISLFLLMGVSYFASFYFKSHSKKLLETAMEENKNAASIANFLSKEKLEADARSSKLEIGKFVIELLPVPEAVNRSGASMNLAEIVLVIECDTGVTCNFIKNHMVQVRSEITNVFVPVDRSVLMTVAGKNHIKNQIRQRLNSWLGKGRVEDVYITDFVIG